MYFETMSSCSPAGLQLTYPLVLTPQAFGLQVCTTRPSNTGSFRRSTDCIGPTSSLVPCKPTLWCCILAWANIPEHSLRITLPTTNPSHSDPSAISLQTLSLFPAFLRVSMSPGTFPPISNSLWLPQSNGKPRLPPHPVHSLPLTSLNLSTHGLYIQYPVLYSDVHTVHTSLPSVPRGGKRVLFSCKLPAKFSSTLS